MKYNPK